MNQTRILDCTLRDGGYYTNWDFDSDLVDLYINSLNVLPIEYIEVGYRSVSLKGYLGEFFYYPPYLMQRMREKSQKKIVIILNEKDIKPTDINDLLTPCQGFVDMIRIAVDPKNLKRAILLSEKVKALGFSVAFNVMYMSTWGSQMNFLDEVANVNGVADFFYMVDSFGGVYPNDVKSTFQLIRERVDTKIGFHGHNNMELALINTLTAIECGADIVDATVTGMGRGAGNLKTELLLTALTARDEITVDYNALSEVVAAFTDLQDQYGWGTNLPYMVSGANSLPQKEVMEWVSKRYYSLNSIVRALSNQSMGIDDNQSLDKLDFQKSKAYSGALVVGGGFSVSVHTEAILHFLSKNPDLVVIHASAKNSRSFENVGNDQFFCLVGNEGHRLENVFDKREKIEGTCILPPYPRKMGTYIPTALEGQAFELSQIDFTDKFRGSHTSIALQAIVEMKVPRVYLVGYDGYSGGSIGRKEQELFFENEYMFKRLKDGGVKISSLTPSEYGEIDQDSVYKNL